MHLEQIMAKADIINGELDRIAFKLDQIADRVALISEIVEQINTMFKKYSGLEIDHSIYGKF
jgi:uncharacterized protein YoxC